MKLDPAKRPAPIFRPVLPMLAAKLAIEDVPDQCWLVSPKLDGIRSLRTPAGSRSRSGKRHGNLALMEALEELPVGLDGELMAGDMFAPFEKTQSQVNTIEARAEGMTYFVYDWFLDGYDKPADWRQEKLVDVVFDWNASAASRSNPVVLSLVGQTTCTRKSSVLGAYQRALVSNLEGICLRAPQSGYHFGRVADGQDNLIAIKEWVDFEARLTSIIPQYENTSPKETGELGYAKRAQDKDQKIAKPMMGTMRFTAINGPWDGQEFHVGGGKGVDHQFRKHMWDSPDDYLQRIATLKGQKIGSQDKPRIPQFVRWREQE